jgi:hypothetical protein
MRARYREDEHENRGHAEITGRTSEDVAANPDEGGWTPDGRCSDSAVIVG